LPDIRKTAGNTKQVIAIAAFFVEGGPRLFSIPEKVDEREKEISGFESKRQL